MEQLPLSTLVPGEVAQSVEEGEFPTNIFQSSHYQPKQGAELHNVTVLV